MPLPTLRSARAIYNLRQNAVASMKLSPVFFVASKASFTPTINKLESVVRSVETSIRRKAVTLTERHGRVHLILMFGELRGHTVGPPGTSDIHIPMGIECL